MNKRIALIIGGVLVVALAGYAFYPASDGPAPASTTRRAASTPQPTRPQPTPDAAPAQREARQGDRLTGAPQEPDADEILEDGKVATKKKGKKNRKRKLPRKRKPKQEEEDFSAEVPEKVPLKKVNSVPIGP